MKRFSHPSRHGRALLCAFGALALSGGDPELTSRSSNDERAADDSITNVAKNLARMNYGTQIEWTTPDGRTARSRDRKRDEPERCRVDHGRRDLELPVAEGETTFVIKLPTTAQLDRFTFVNENAAAAGSLKISVSNYKLPAASPKWTEVDGSISFTRKRLFNLSMLGVEARYVKLSFNVEKPGRIASLGLYGGETLERFALRQEQTHQQITWLSNSAAARARRHRRSAEFQFRKPLRKGAGSARQLRPDAGRTTDDR